MDDIFALCDALYLRIVLIYWPTDWFLLWECYRNGKDMVELRLVNLCPFFMRKGDKTFQVWDNTIYLFWLWQPCLNELMHLEWCDRKAETVHLQQYSKLHNMSVNWNHILTRSAHLWTLDFSYMDNTFFNNRARNLDVFWSASRTLLLYINIWSMLYLVSSRQIYILLRFPILHYQVYKSTQPEYSSILFPSLLVTNYLPR